MTLGRTASRALIPLSVFALLGSGLALHDPMAEVGASLTTEDVAGTPAVVSDTAVKTVDPAERAPADQEAAPEGEATPEEPGTPEDSEPNVLAAPEAEEDLDEGHGEEGHVHVEVPGGVVVAELEPRELEPFAMLGVTWSSGLDGAGSRVEARWRADGTWSDWTELHVEPSTEGVPGTEPQWVGQADAAAVRVISSTGAQPQDVELSTVDPGQVPDVAPAAFATASTSGVPKPRIISRSSWGASGGTSCDTSRPGATMKGVVIHHTAGSNNYSKSQSASIVKSTQAYHTGSRAWCDIGYNFLVDKYGQIFEGRKGGVDKLVRAAHSGNGPVNEDTSGISMMGSFSSTAPTAALKSAVARLTAWKFAIHKVPATGTYSSGGVTLNRIAGHRNVVGTECPGNAAYPWVVSGLRTDVAQKLRSASSFDWPAPSNVKIKKSNTSWNLQWSAVPEVKTFFAQVSTSPSMSNPLKRSFDSRSGTITGLKPSTNYYVRLAVSHSRTGAQTSAFSPVVSGKTFDWAPPASTTVSPQSSSSVAVKWSPVAGVASYRVELSTSASMSKPVVKSSSATTGTFTGLRPGTRYYARVAVRHSRTGAQTSAYGSTASGTTRAAAATTPAGWDWAAPSNVVASGPTTSSMKMRWSAVPGPKAFLVQVSRSASMSSPVVRTFDAKSGTVGGLVPSTTYYVRVAVRHSRTGAQTSAFSPVVKATTVAAAKAAPAPTFDWAAPTAVRVKKANTSWALRWSAGNGPKSFLVQVSRSASMSSPVVRTFNATSGTVTGLTSSTNYYMRVAVRHSRTGAQTSPFSAVVSGRTFDWAAPASTTLSGASSSSIAAAWTAVPGVKSYRVEVSTSASMSRPSVKTSSKNKMTITGLAPGKTYYVRVATRHSRTGAQTSAYGPTRSAKTSSAAPAGTNSFTVGSSRSITFEGHGYGHGIGMSQYGARGAATLGKGAGEILATYYPGTKLSNKSGDIRVLISADSDGSTTVTGQAGLRFRQGSTSLTLPTSVGGKAVIFWKIGPDLSDPRKSSLRYKAGSSWQGYQNRTWTGTAEFAASTITVELPGGDLVKYRNRLVAAQATSTTRRTVNVLNLDDYTRGVVAREVPASWPKEALRAQAVAARTYGLRSIKSGGYYDICDTTSCQVYGGYSAEDPRTNSAVSTTPGNVLLYNGSPALTQFSSSSGGYTNAGSQPYLKAINDPWDGVSGNPNHNWSQAVSASVIEARNPSIGSLRSLQVTKRNGKGEMGGRAVSLKLTGSKGSVTVSGSVARFAFGLKSDWFGF